MLTTRVTTEVTMQIIIAEIIVNPWEEGGTELVVELWAYGFVSVLLLYLATVINASIIITFFLVNIIVVASAHFFNSW